MVVKDETEYLEQILHRIRTENTLEVLFATIREYSLLLESASSEHLKLCPLCVCTLCAFFPTPSHGKEIHLRPPYRLPECASNRLLQVDTHTFSATVVGIPADKPIRFYLFNTMADSTTNLAAASLTFSVLSFIMLAITLVFFLFPDFSSTIRSGLARTSGAPGFGSSFKTFAAFLGALSPDITLLSGFVSDFINGSFRYSVTSIIGVCAVILHWIVAGLMYGFSKDTGPSAIATAAATLTSAASSSAVVEQLLGTGAETSTGGIPDVPSGPRSATRRTVRRVRGPGSMTTMSSLPTVADLATGNTARTAALNPRPITGPTGSRMSRSTQGRTTRYADYVAGGGEEGQTGGGWEIPDDVRSSFNPCSIRGLGMFDISNSPMGMAALSSVFAVYLLDMTVNSKRSSGDVLVYLGFSGAVFGLNLFSYSTFKCYGDSFGAIAKATLLPLLLGFLAGGIGFATLKSTFPAYLPLDAHNMGDPALPSKQATCAPPNDQDQFVCDAYKDGKRVTSTVVS